MAAQGADEQPEAVGAVNTVWPPPPTCEPPEAVAPRRSLLPIHLPLPQMPKGFGLPRWAKASFANAVFIFIALDLRHKAPFIGQIIVGLSIAFYSVLLFTMLFWAVRAMGRFVVHKVTKTPLELPPVVLSDYIPSTGGWMGFIPASAFWIWGQFYLFGGLASSVNLTILAVQAAWFVLGCIVAAVNGVGQWWRNRHAPSEADSG